MLRRIAPLLALVMALGCAKKGPTAPTVHPAVEDTIDDQGTPFGIRVGWRQVTPDTVEIVIKMVAQSIDQTEKLVADVSTHGFVIVEGTPQWEGFVQPREKYEHRVSYKLLEDADSGRVSVTMRHSMDGTLLWDTELLFRAEAGGITLAQ